jgi:hypothetical protein
MSRTHSAGSRKSSPCQSAPHVVLRVAMTAREIRASQADDRFHLSRRYVHGEQFSSEPQIDDAPVNLGKAFLNMPTLHPASINTRGSLRRHRAFLADVQARIDAMRRRSWRLRCNGVHGRTQQILGSTGQNRTSFDDFDPRSRTGGSTAFEFLIGESCQSSQVAPVSTSQVASVGVRQLFTDDRGYARFQGRDADTNPSLEMARTSLEHYRRLMAMGSHQRQHIGSSVIQIEENVTGVAILGVGEKINIKALKIACAQKAHHRSTGQITNIPNSLTRAKPSCAAMDQANEIEIIRHGRQLAPDRVGSEEESAIKHEHENAIEAPHDYNDFSSNGNNPLNAVSHSRGAPQVQ